MTCPHCGNSAEPCETRPVETPSRPREGCDWCHGTGTLDLTTGRVTAYLRPSRVACPRCNPRGDHE